LLTGGVAFKALGGICRNEPSGCYWLGYSSSVIRWKLSDQELDDMAANLESTEPDYAPELRRLKAWRREHCPARAADRDLSTTQRYIHVSPAAAENAIRVLD
jgi:hypothetical protein